MSTVETVRGPVDVAALGPTLMHEHIFVVDPSATAELQPRLGRGLLGRGGARRRRDPEAAAAARRRHPHARRPDARRGLGRYIPRIQRINAEVDLNIIVATGVYAFLELPGFLAYRSDDAIVELFVREIREGIDDTGVKAAFLKCAVEAHGMIGDVPRIFAARRRGRASRRARRSWCTRTRPAQDRARRARDAHARRASTRGGS